MYKYKSKNRTYLTVIYADQEYDEGDRWVVRPVGSAAYLDLFKDEFDREEIKPSIAEQINQLPIGAQFRVRSANTAVAYRVKVTYKQYALVYDDGRVYLNDVDSHHNETNYEEVEVIK